MAVTVAAGVALGIFGGPIAALPEECKGFATGLKGSGSFRRDAGNGDRDGRAPIRLAPVDRLEVTQQVVNVTIGQARVFAGAAVFVKLKMKNEKAGRMSVEGWVEVVERGLVLGAFQKDLLGAG